MHQEKANLSQETSIKYSYTSQHHSQWKEWRGADQGSKCSRLNHQVTYGPLQVRMFSINRTWIRLDSFIRHGRGWVRRPILSNSLGIRLESNRKWGRVCRNAGLAAYSILLISNGAISRVACISNNRLWKKNKNSRSSKTRKRQHKIGKMKHIGSFMI